MMVQNYDNSLEMRNVGPVLANHLRFVMVIRNLPDALVDR